MKYLNELTEITKAYHPTLYTQACFEYPTLQEGDYVLDCSHDLALICENGTYQIVWQDNVCDYSNPIPAMKILLEQGLSKEQTLESLPFALPACRPAKQEILDAEDIEPKDF